METGHYHVTLHPKKYTPKDEQLDPEKWWFGSDDFPFPGGRIPYSQVNQPLIFGG